MSQANHGNVRVRFAPSPTGPFHLGGARTALFNWLFAKKNGGKFILRIEDTDKERSEKKYEDMLIDALSWLGIDWDEGPDKGGDYGPYRQTERLHIYREYLETLIKSEWAYYCYCTKDELEERAKAMELEGIAPKYSGHCRNIKEPPSGKSPQVIRFKMPNTNVDFKDLIRGKVTFDASLFGDVVIAKDLDTPLYNFAVVVDDHLMEITHVVRGEEHLSNTPKQILMARAMSLREPEFAHLPLILSSDRKKLSKRFAEVSLLAYRDKGYLPEAIDNFLALLGWHPEIDREVLTIEELKNEFEIKRVQKSGAVFNEEKLSWLNGEHLKKASNEELLQKLKPILSDKIKGSDDDFIIKVIGAVRERMKTLNDFWDFSSFFFELPDYNKEMLKWQDDPMEKTRGILEKVKDKIAPLEGEVPRETILLVLDDLIAQFGKGSVLWPLRVSLSGKPASPDPIEIVRVLGGAESSRRVDIALQKLQ